MVQDRSIDLVRIQNALSSISHEFVYLTKETCPATLREALQTQFPDIPKDLWPAKLARGGTYVNGQIVQSDMTLPIPCRIEHFEPKENTDLESYTFRKNIKNFIIFEDAHLLVIYKISGLSSMPTREQRNANLNAYLVEYLQETRGTSELHMPSRVDTSVEGLVVTSVNKQTHKQLQRVYEQRMITKTYLLQTDRKVDWEKLEVTLAIDHDQRHPVLRKTVSQGGKPAHTIFKGLAKNDTGSLLSAHLITGRTHQIRLHASSSGFPICGDNFYGGSVADLLHLISFSSEFYHPVTREKLRIVVPERLYPKWLVPWGEFIK